MLMEILRTPFPPPPTPLYFELDVLNALALDVLSQDLVSKFGFEELSESFELLRCDAFRVSDPDAFGLPTRHRILITFACSPS